MFWVEIWKMSEFLSENFQFLVVKFSIYLNRRVFVMGHKYLKCSLSPLLWAGTQHFLLDCMCTQRRCWSGCPPKDAFDHCLSRECPAKTLISLRIRRAHMQCCRKCWAPAHLFSDTFSSPQTPSGNREQDNCEEMWFRKYCDLGIK